jgi:hypothetical protein
VKVEKPSLPRGEQEARERFVRRLVLAEVIARRGEGPLAPRFALRPARVDARAAAEEPKP